MDTLIIVAPLSCPPSELSAFRTLTMISRYDLNKNVLIEVEKNFKDLYYFYLKRKGLLDFVNSLIVPEEKEHGIRLDIEFKSAPTIQTDRIVLNNLQHLTSMIKCN